MRLVSTHVLVRTLFVFSTAVSVTLSAVLGADSDIVQAQSANQVTVAVGSMPLQSGPSSSATTVEQLHRGDVVTIDARNTNADWLHGAAPDGQVGWVEVAFLLLPPHRQVLSQRIP